MTCSFGYVMDI